MSIWLPASAGIPARDRISPVLEAFPIACFTLTLVTDLAYWRSANLIWQNFSSWLLAFGLLGGALVAIWWLIGLGLGWWRPNWIGSALAIAALIVAFVNSLVHAGDGWTGVVPWGIALSVVTLILMLAVEVLGARIRY